MKFCYNANFTLPKQCQRSRSVFQDGSRSLRLFWKENNPSYNRRSTVLATLTIILIPVFVYAKRDESNQTAWMCAVQADLGLPCLHIIVMPFSPLKYFQNN